MGTRQDRATWIAYMKSIIATNGTKSITGATNQAVLDNLGESVVFYNEQQSKENVVVATTAAGTLATSFENGDTIDGVVLATGNRILIKDQSTASENGVYTVNASGAPTRATDFDTADEVILGSEFFVTEGTANGGKKFRLTAPTGTITLGSSNLTFTVEGSTFDISGLSSFSGTVDTTNDYLAVYDNSGATNLKIATSRVVPLYGTFTPGIAFGGGTTGITYGTQTGTYVETVLNDGKYKIDFNIELTITSKGSSSGDLTVTGLPRTSNANYLCLFAYDPNSASITGTKPFTARVSSGTTTISFYVDQFTDDAIDNADISISTSIIFSLTGFYISG